MYTIYKSMYFCHMSDFHHAVKSLLSRNTRCTVFVHVKTSQIVLHDFMCTFLISSVSSGIYLHTFPPIKPSAS